MGKSIAELRASKHVGLPEKVVGICVSGSLYAELEDLQQKLAEAEAEYEEAKKQAERAEEGKAPQRTMATKPRVRELQEKADARAVEADAKRDEVLEHTVDVLFRAKRPGEWRQWCAENPATEGSVRDRITYGLCALDALEADLGSYVVEIAGEKPQPGDWQWIADNAAAGALTNAAKTVFAFHETVVNPGKSRVTLLNDRRNAIS